MAVNTNVSSGLQGPGLHYKSASKTQVPRGKLCGSTHAHTVALEQQNPFFPPAQQQSLCKQQKASAAIDTLP